MRGGESSIQGGQSRGKGGDKGQGGKEGEVETGGVGRKYGQTQGKYRKNQGNFGPLSSRLLIEILEKDPSEAATELGSLKGNLQAGLNEDSMDEVRQHLFWDALAFMCGAVGAEQTVIMLLTMAMDSKLCRQHLLTFLTKVKRPEEKIDERRLKILKNVTTVFFSAMQSLPSRASDLKVAVTLISDAVSDMDQDDKRDDIMKSIKSLSNHIEVIEKERDTKRQMDRISKNPPPDDFRQQDILPTVKELQPGYQPFLRPHLTRGVYADADHYLDVQFRLLKEDFIYPLRNGISEYLTFKKANPDRRAKLQDVRIYEEAHYKKSVRDFSGISHYMAFKKLPHVRWYSTKRLMYGSLLILSTDDFKSFIFATVANRDVEDLEKGMVAIALVDREDASCLLNKRFVMAESSVFFEAYRPVLLGLQGMSGPCLPFSQYTLSMFHDVKPPRYLQDVMVTENGEMFISSCSIDISPLLKDKRGCSPTIDVLDDGAWPEIDAVQLDQSQYEAAKTALTKELSVIQGPPGTGKTYIGLKIIETLLLNREVWSSKENPSPILLVCYTNHALDQFLEGILTFHQTGIVRIGSRSKSEKLQPFNLNRMVGRRGIHGEEYVQRRVRHVKNEVVAAKRRVERTQARIEGARNGIINENELGPFMSRQHYNSLLRFSHLKQSNSWLVEWLLCEHHNDRDLNQQWNRDTLIQRNNLQEEESGKSTKHDPVANRATVEVEYERSAIESKRMFDDEYDEEGSDEEEDEGHPFLGLDLDDLNKAEDGTLRRYVQRKISGKDVLDPRALQSIMDVWRMRPNDRWALYHVWLRNYLQQLKEKLPANELKFKQRCGELDEAKHVQKYQVLRQATIIGMTTTGAANHQKVLHRVRPKIVVVEEAAEVLEAHIITALNASCQQLILIGDHQQLRPKPNVYYLAKKYHLDVSLFERLIKNEFPYSQLKLQHRMRIELSDLMRRNFYDNLQDHDTVKRYGNVKAVQKDIFFLDHAEPEDEMDDTQSHYNLHEARLVVALCYYFLQQGYEPDKVTILTAYTGQLLKIKQMMDRSRFEGVKVTSIDNYQGEENDIILLSFVRSNSHGQIGFLGISNRVCVSLSRAKIGLYCVGNFTLFAEKSDLWKGIVKDLEAMGSIGDSLTLQCTNHSEEGTAVKTADDFKKVPLGGCSRDCDTRMDCGHVCRIKCHPTDLKHLVYKCKEKVDKTLSCSHVQSIPCHRSTAGLETECEVIINKELQCGHRKTEKCNGSGRCDEIVLKVLGCNHTCQAACHKDPKNIRCKENVEKTLPCGHTHTLHCSGTNKPRIVEKLQYARNSIEDEHLLSRVNSAVKGACEDCDMEKAEQERARLETSAWSTRRCKVNNTPRRIEHERGGQWVCYQSGRERGRRGDDRGGWRRERDKDGGRRDRRVEERGRWRHGKDARGGDRGAGGWRRDKEEDGKDRHRRRGEIGAREGGIGNRPRGEEKEHDDAGAQGNGDRRGEPRHNQARGPRVVHSLGYKTLEQLLSKDPDDAAQELGSLKQGLSKLLEMTDIRYDLISLLFQVLHHVCRAQVSNETINMLLDMLGMEKFISNHLNLHLIAMRTERSKTRQRVMPSCIQDIANVLSELQQRLPRYLTDVEVAATLLEEAVKYAEKRKILVDETIQEEVRQLLKLNEPIQQERLKKPRTDIESTAPLPDNFRELSVFPTSNELTDNSLRLYLRKHIKKGKYESVEHYLDVQFRLLREDFVRPLREGISGYKNATARPGKCDKRVQDIRLYYDVTLDEPLYSQTGVTFRIHFDESKLTGVRWQSSKRLIYGSLVILSPDDFKTLIFGTVANRKPDDLAKGFIEIKLERDEEIAEIFTEKTFIMAESSAYFEAYRHVLSRIQHVTEQSMPLTDYIISASPNIRPPAYIRNDRSIEYDLSPIVSGDVPNAKQTTMRIKTVRILDDREWTRLGNTGLDESQLRAVQAALTQEMTVIQGPPGTGKTYIGLKIVHTLLQNKQIWKEAQVLGHAGRTGHANRPILLVCYTNHALDQFLEGVATYNSEGIVRVGGRSSSEALKRFNLNSLRSSKLREETPRHVRRRIGEVHGEIESLGREVKGLQDKINHTKKGLLHERVLMKHMTDAQETSLNQGNIFEVDGQSFLVHWLLGYIQKRCPSEELDVPEDIGLKHEEDDKREEDLNILEEADLLDETRRLDVDYPQDRIFTGDANANFDDDTLAFRLDDLDNLDAGGWQQDRRQVSNRKHNLERKLRSSERMSDQEANAVRDVWGLEEGKRWRLYHYWAHLHRHESHRQLVDKQRKFTNVCQELREARSQEDYEILKNASVVGMTTTGAAKFHMLLQRIQPRIMVVEEAAEVLEAHIVTALTESCQHLILIGDHQQLRPSPTVFKLGTQYNLDISLFERMINNDVPYQQLVLQHRMRPEISRLMRMDRLYPSLKDDDCVKGFDDIQGVTKNIFFIHHEIEEDYVDEMKSHSNIHEAKFLVGLCRYFLQQGYLPEQITILTTYSGQLFAFKGLMKKIDFEGVRVATVDNFQGEENDIILLSLVRSNEEGSTGFLKIDNRICVALSRARKGLYCIGNFKLLAQQNPSGPNLWREIVKDAEIYGTIGKSLVLQCRNHIGTKHEVSSEADFSKVPEGGCSLPCEARLTCGHVCRMPCHTTDMEHENYKCRQKCTRTICPLGHRCMKQCYQPCDTQCKKSVDKTMPCGHVQKVPCYKSNAEVICESPCRRRLDCGHQCKELCGKSCTMLCEEIIRRSDFPCGHNVLDKCSAGPESCSEPCDKILSCEHSCKGSCGKCHQGRLHAFCRERCDRTLVCGHPCRSTCAADCPPCSRRCENRCQHSKCKKNCGEPCVPCAERCTWRCQHFRCGAKCGKPCDRRACNDPCTLLLKCGHPCIGLCGEPCPKKCRICDKEEVTRILFGDEDDVNARFVELEDCKHVIEADALDQWMKTDSGSKDTSEAISIKLKECPWCKTPIRRNLRYGNLIKQALDDINAVKRTIFGDENTIHYLRQNLQKRLKNMDIFAITSDARRFQGMVYSTSALSHGQITALKNRVRFLKEMRDLAKALQSLQSPFLNQQYVNQMKSEIVGLQTWLCQEPIDRMSQQQTDDANREAKRLHLALNFFRILDEKPAAHDKASQEVKAAELQLFDGKALTAQRADEVKSLLKKIDSKSGGLEISETERKEVVAAMGLAKGHWYKCPKGHVYAIGECGGATQTGKCPECGLGIGGTGHRLTEGNRVASEMDGARHAAWSEEANNMANFNLNNLH
ncbi:NFX1-type zinc finger-containing protein 1-like [Strongylocentrotus purpuratus]|uniref:RZ-type domain-containing protein n=1 Tax=Strongylocentrotus purpuratus TaxID=7668 RepID=A0A7M7P6U3_STRPU|nr:NFX1-type zinc finger-containing protein 1-like [Strongylocentrotus purpuratus]